MGLFRASGSSIERPLVSVVTPVYNVERYLPECLDSLRAQKLRDMEFICVNDGSTDGSLEILERYAAEDPRFKVISKPNGGYGETMNVGMDAARGEYVGILESDDYADPNMYRDLYRFAKRRDLDLVKANYFEHNEAGDTLMEPFAGFAYRTVFDPREDQGVMTVLPIIWSALYRRSMLVDNGIRFNETPGASFQDTSFVQQVWMCARRVAILRRAYLHYRVDNAGSSVKSASKVYAICDEYEFSKRFMERDPERVESFSKILNLLKLGSYKWNYGRIADEYHREFAERMAKEFREARDEGSLDRSYFAPQDQEALDLLMDDVDGFLERFPEEWPYV